MKRCIKFLSALIVISMSTVGVVNAQTIAGTAHDLTSTAGGSFSVPGEINGADLCRFCHAPHVAAVGVAPLWDRDTPAGPFDTYDSVTMSTSNKNVVLSGVSLGCLSCHDGVTAFDSLTAVTTPALGAMTGTAVMGTDLNSDHPIGITTTSAAGEMNSDASIIAAGLQLFGAGDAVECASCHKVHDNSNTKFLRLPTTSSILCSTCHIK